MVHSRTARLRKLTSGVGVRQIRLACGVVLFAYLISHFLNHALGNISPQALFVGLVWHTTFWQFPPVAVVFYAAVLVHTGLGIWALYERREFHWRTIEPLQLVLGLSVPALIAAHVIGLRLGQTLYAQQKIYPQVFYAYWVDAPLKMWLMYLVLIVAWVHGCIGIYFWLRLKRWFRSAAPVLLAFAVLIPAVAMLGLYQGGRTTAADSTDPAWRKANLSPQQLGTPAQQDVLAQITNGFLIGYAALLALALAGRIARSLNERRGGIVKLTGGDGRSMRVPKGTSVLEACLRYNVPHASICGGRARCSTCRIRIVGDPAALPPPSKRETFVLDRIGAGDDPSIRLACQLRPATDLSFFPVFVPQTAQRAIAKPARTGQERYLVSMFVDMRGSTRLAEKRLPFDTVFIVNRFLGAVSQAVIACDGQPNQFIGDGLLALFGLATDPRTACRQALQAAAMIAANVDGLNEFLGDELPEPIRFGIGIHGGEVIVGDIGYRDHVVFTALGDAVNVAARLQDMTKAFACEVILSDDTRARAGLPNDLLPTQDVEIRGRAQLLPACIVEQARSLSAVLTGTEPETA